MSLLKKKRIKPQLTLRIFLWALVDVVGMLLSQSAAFISPTDRGRSSSPSPPPAVKPQ